MTRSLSMSSLFSALAALFIALFLARLSIHQLLSLIDVTPSLLALTVIEAVVSVILSGAILSQPLQRWQRREISRVAKQASRLRRAVQRQEFATDLTTALGQSVNEDEARWVIRRALDQISPDAPVELLLTDPRSARLQRALVGGHVDAGFGCPVRASGDCPAMRSGQIRTGSSRDLDACRMLAERSAPCHGLCVPVTINGQALGVLHTAPVRAPSAESRVRLQIVAEQAGVRLGLFRVMAATRHAASTDELTGLLNRRALMSRIEALTADRSDYALAIADIDHFKRLNDTYGHPVGDRALQVFAKALQHHVGSDDVVARLGGEEFVIILPGRSAEQSLETIGQIQLGLPVFLARDNLPGFTASFGVADARHGVGLEERLRAADEALYASKHNGRDQATVAEAHALREAM
ncbi:MAG: GGDEF domain-containing protein [Myxococcota bacterium]